MLSNLTEVFQSYLCLILGTLFFLMKKTNVFGLATSFCGGSFTLLPFYSPEFLFVSLGSFFKSFLLAGRQVGT